jgi:O-antigen/teichoic acid export membrane protein
VKTQILKALKNDNFLSLSGNMSVAVFGFLGFFILVRTVSPNIYGEWVIYITAGNFIEMLRFGITRTAIIRFLSGSKGKERESLLGSNWYIGLVATTIVSIIIWSTYFLFSDKLDGSGYSLFFIWYPLLSFINLPFNNAISVMNADRKFDQMLFIRAFNTGSFVFFLIVNYFFLHWGIMSVLYAHLIINILTSLICLVKKWDGIQYIFKTTKESNRVIFKFGKYSTGTLIGANLLKSSDTILIGLSPFLGTVGVAFYSVPLKLTEILEIPLRSFVATAFPKMSKASMENNIEEVKRIYYSYAGGLTFIILPIVLIGFIFAEEFVLILGGARYIDTKNIFRIFCIYGLFISIDKFTGVALDSINRPKRNFLKVVYMASANIIGDIVAIFFMSKFMIVFSIIVLFVSTQFGMFDIGFNYSMIFTLEMVSFVTIIFTIIGILVGINYLKKDLDIQKRLIFIEGWKFFKQIITDILGIVRK